MYSLVRVAHDWNYMWVPGTMQQQCSSMSYFDRDDVALPHFSRFFKDQSREKQEHAEKLLKFQNQRGGRVLLQDVKKPERDELGNSLQAMQVALDVEKNVNQSLLDLHQ
ncbi:ferritin, heavy subunit-like, partial [Stegostoma tigrinum]